LALVVDGLDWLYYHQFDSPLPGAEELLKVHCCTPYCLSSVEEGDVHESGGIQLALQCNLDYQKEVPRTSIEVDPSYKPHFVGKLLHHSSLKMLHWSSEPTWRQSPLEPFALVDSSFDRVQCWEVDNPTDGRDWLVAD
jgi:hypothetical protein